MAEWFALLGPLGYPLVACSVIAVALVVERLIAFAMLPNVARVERNRSGVLAEAFDVLDANKDQPRSDRNDIVSLWLGSYADRVHSNIRWLNLIAAIAPMLGLLGTVLGMTGAFQAISKHTGPISPQVLSGGIWEAMLTTLAGLAIAIPVLVFAHIFKAVAAAHVERVSTALNRYALRMDGLSVRADDARQKLSSDGKPVAVQAER